MNSMDDKLKIEIKKGDSYETQTHESRDFEKHLKKKFNVRKDGRTWEGAEAEVKSAPMIDPGVGKGLVIRCFEFGINPSIKYTPTKQELFNYHWQQIKTMLWGDGLIANEDVAPRVVVNPKKNSYTIFILAQPRLGAYGMRKSFTETPMTLQDILKKK